MTEGYVGIRKGASKRIILRMRVPKGTLEFAATPKVNIRNSVGTIVGSYSDVALTLYTDGESTQVTATYIFDTSANDFVLGQTYTVQFDVPVTWSVDGGTANPKPVATVRILPVAA